MEAFEHYSCSLVVYEHSPCIQWMGQADHHYHSAKEHFLAVRVRLSTQCHHNNEADAVRIYVDEVDEEASQSRAGIYEGSLRFQTCQRYTVSRLIISNDVHPFMTEQDIRLPLHEFPGRVSHDGNGSIHYVRDVQSFQLRLVVLSRGEVVVQSCYPFWEKTD